MRSEQTPFVGGPLDGRVLPVFTGVTGNPPKTYRVPVPTEDGAPVVHVYRRDLQPYPRHSWVGRWRYRYDPEGEQERPRVARLPFRLPSHRRSR